jgi:hypothetical protein
MAEAFRAGHLGIMDYYRMRNIQADTGMRESIGGGVPAARQPRPEIIPAQDSLITTIVIIVIAAIATWFKLGQPKDANDDPARDAHFPQGNRDLRPRRARNRSRGWEEELRRLLEGEAPRRAPPCARLRSCSPDQAPRAIPGRPASARPIAPQQRPVMIAAAVPAISAPPVACNLASQPAFERASAPDTVSQIRLAGSGSQLTTVVRQQTSPELLQAISLFQNARSARQAIIASIILAPPKALEQPAMD